MRGGMKVLDQALQRADEVKHPVARERDIEALDALLATLHDKKPVSSRYNRLARRKRRPVYVLQPVLHAIGGCRCRFTSISILPNFTESMPQCPAIGVCRRGNIQFAAYWPEPLSATQVIKQPHYFFQWRSHFARSKYAEVWCWIPLLRRN